MTAQYHIRSLRPEVFLSSKDGDLVDRKSTEAWAQVQFLVGRLGSLGS